MSRYNKMDATGVVSMDTATSEIIDQLNILMDEIRPGQIISSGRFVEMQFAYQKICDEVAAIGGLEEELRELALGRIEKAEELEDQIRDLEDENASLQGEVDSLESQVADLEDQVSNLTAQVDGTI